MAVFDYISNTWRECMNKITKTKNQQNKKSPLPGLMILSQSAWDFLDFALRVPSARDLAVLSRLGWLVTLFPINETNKSFWFIPLLTKYVLITKTIQVFWWYLEGKYNKMSSHRVLRLMGQNHESERTLYGWKLAWNVQSITLKCLALGGQSVRISQVTHFCLVGIFPQMLMLWRAGEPIDLHKEMYFYEE